MSCRHTQITDRVPSTMRWAHNQCRHLDHGAITLLPVRGGYVVHSARGHVGSVTSVGEAERLFPAATVTVRA